MTLGTLGLTVAGAAEAGAGIFNPETFTLANGMEVVVVPNHRAPVVAHWVWYKVGTADSPPGKSGLPHYLEHLMFKGTDKIPLGEFSKIVARNGGNDNAMTSYDFTAYYQMIAKDRLPLVMGMEADRMANLKLEPKSTLTERDVILEERRMRVDNEPSSLLSEQMSAVQYLNHPYRLPIIGWYGEIAGYTREDALDFYAKWYAPNNAVLVVAGDVTAAELKPLAEATYGKVARKDVPERHRVEEPPQRSARQVVLEHPQVGEPSFSRSYLAPSYVSKDKGHAYALDVLSELLGGGGTSRLYKGIAVDQGLATSVGAYYRGEALDQTTFQLYASPRPGIGLDRIEAAIDAEVDRLLKDGVKDDEVARVKKRMLAEAVYARDSLSGAARIFGVALTTGQTVADVEAWPDRIAAVTPDEVMAAARLVLDPDRSVTGRLLPFPGSATADAGAAPVAPGKSIVE
ncbi:MAG: insulinase family protein [Geminicoccaceae bacterium]|nr:insulinase family protein [Geminicoccaceae bacterium]